MLHLDVLFHEAAVWTFSKVASDCREGASTAALISRSAA